MIKIRTFNRSDAHAVGQLFYDTVHAINAKDYAPELINMWAPNNDEFSKLVSSCEHNVFFVAEQNEIMVGFGDMNNEGHIERLFVHKDHQGKHIGTLLFKALEDAAYELGFSHITTEASVRAMPFFARQGFEITETLHKEHPYEGLIFTTYSMSKKLV